MNIILKCENLINPLGIDNLQPKFSWNLKGLGDNNQKAYRIIVSNSTAEIKKNIGSLWDSGKVYSSNNVNIKYKGKQLKSRKIYYWKVRIWISNNKIQEYSPINKFEMGLLNGKEWSGNWIEGKNSGELFRKVFDIKKEIARARVYISGLGLYKLYINGEKVGDRVLDPGVSDYKKKILYSTYDISKGLKVGKNSICVILGNGFFSSPNIKNKDKLRKNIYKYNPILIANLIVTLKDGTSNTICTDSSWKFNKGPIISDDLYNGEIYDARFEKKNWKCLDYNDGDWDNAKILSYVKDRFVSQTTLPAIKKRKKIIPKKIIKTSNKKIIYDFGKNFSGWIKVKASGTTGDKIIIKFAELLNTNKTLNLLPNRSAKSEDIYIFGEEKLITYEPSFTYHGFRYAQVETIGEVVINQVIGFFVNSSVKKIGKFECSNKLINKLHRNILWGQLSNLMSIPTDCAQRDERQGWLADAHLTAEEAIYNFDMLNFYKKYINDIKISQKEDGSISDVVPPFWDFYDAAPEWGAACILIPWYVYIYYGDIEVLKENYDMMAYWHTHLHKYTENGILKFEKYGDWCPPTQTRSYDTPLYFVSTWYYYYTTVLLRKISSILGKKDEAIHLFKKSEEIRNSFINEFVSKDKIKNGFAEIIRSEINNNIKLDTKTKNDTLMAFENTGGIKCQTTHTLALFLDMMPNDIRKSLLNQLLECTVKYNSNHLYTGIIGTKYILDVLASNGYGDIAFKILTQTTYPSLGYMIKEGATTLWEKWEYLDNYCMNSHNHIMFGSIDAWFYKYLAGINPDENNPGFKKIIIKPLILDDLKYVKAEIKTIRGLVKSEWRKTNGFIELKTKIPSNCEAEILLPWKLFKGWIVKEKGKIIWRGNSFQKNSKHIKSINSIRVDGNFIKIFIYSGEFDFKIERERF